MKQTELRHEFVEFIPEEIAEGVLYVSIPYATAVHRCCSGCGREVVTPLTPTDWQLLFDGETVSLEPSIGNWNFECRSHYWITRGKVEWAGRWTRDQIDAGRARDRRLKRAHHAGLSHVDAQESVSEATEASGFWRRLLRRWR